MDGHSLCEFCNFQHEPYLSVDSGITLPDGDPSEGTCGESPKNTEAAVSGSNTAVRRYPVRNRNPPQRFFLNGPVLSPVNNVRF